VGSSHWETGITVKKQIGNIGTEGTFTGFARSELGNVPSVPILQVFPRSLTS
jgi:hypothetical protein